MKKIESLEQANEISAVRLTEKRQMAKVGDIFRYSPEAGVYGWGRLIQRGHFFAMKLDLNLVYIYDAWGERKPDDDRLSPANLLIGPVVVNNLGWSRGYWELVDHAPIVVKDVQRRHVFIQFGGSGPKDFIYVDGTGSRVLWPRVERRLISQSGVGNFNSVNWAVREILEERGSMKDVD